jgi:N-hydroxyarylamine O-acetyltransferase
MPLLVILPLRRPPVNGSPHYGACAHRLFELEDMPLDVRSYLARIGYTGSASPSAETLRSLQRAHLLAVPFEALDCYLGVPIRLEPQALFDKIVVRGRGGFCYELNGLFAELLDSLGFSVRRLAARPFTAEGLAPPFAHLALLVELEQRWLADVGFGYFALQPLDLDERSTQARHGRRFRVTDEDGGLVAEEVGMRSRWGYRFDLEPHALEDFAEQCRAYSTDPESSFVRRATVSQAFPDGWVTVTRDQVIGGRGGRRLDRPIVDDTDWRRTMRELLGVDLSPRGDVRIAARP